VVFLGSGALTAYPGIGIPNQGIPDAKSLRQNPIYRGRRFCAETIELCVRWYLTYRLSYRDLSAMMAEQGINVSHTTIVRWVIQSVPEYERRWAIPRLIVVGSS
jgi:hypothetical protein